MPLILMYIELLVNAIFIKLKDLHVNCYVYFEQVFKYKYIDIMLVFDTWKAKLHFYKAAKIKPVPTLWIFGYFNYL